MRLLTKIALRFHIHHLPTHRAPVGFRGFGHQVEILTARWTLWVFHRAILYHLPRFSAIRLSRQMALSMASLI